MPAIGATIGADAGQGSREALCVQLPPFCVERRRKRIFMRESHASSSPILRLPYEDVSPGICTGCTVHTCPTQSLPPGVNELYSRMLGEDHGGAR